MKQEKNMDIYGNTEVTNITYIGHKEPRAASLPGKPEEMKI
jgi:hypothetical protein